MSDNQKAINSLERENSINKGKIESLQRADGIMSEQLKILTNNVHNNPVLDTEPGIVNPSKAIIVSKDGTIDNLKLTGNLVATNIKNYYQTVNSENSTVGDKGSTTQITNAGCPSSASDWIRYESWKTSSADTINSNPNVFSPQNYGFKSLVAGTYKITLNIAIQAVGSNQSIVIRLAKNALNDDVADSDQENPGALAGTGYLPGFGGSNAGKINSFGSASITHIMTLSVNDEVSMYTTNTSQVHSGSGVNSFTREGYSQLLVEYLGV